MEDMDEIIDAVDGLETYVMNVSDELRFANDRLATIENDLSDIKRMLAIATSPSKEEQEQFKIIKEAYDQYTFVRKLAQGGK